MAFIVLHVLLLGVIAATADDGRITWLSATQPRSVLRCVVADAAHIQPRGPPPPLAAEGPDEVGPNTKTRHAYHWRKLGENSRNLTERIIDSSGGLEVSLQSGAGVYQCWVRHRGGRVLGYPVHLKYANIDESFSVHPDNVTVLSGQPVALFCNITSTPPAHISWQKDGKKLPEHDRYYPLNNVLIIHDAEPEDAGLYRCIARNKHVDRSPLRSNEGKLQVIEGTKNVEPAFLTVHYERNITELRGSTVVLPCPVNAYPRVKLKWMLTPPVGRRSELEDVEEILVLRKLESDQEGVYTCEIEGHNHLNKSFSVTMMEPPVIKYPPVSVVKPRANLARFNCTASGNPAPVVTWYKDGQLLDMTGRSKVYNSTLKDGSGQIRQLVIDSIASNDEGVYQCFVENMAGISSSWAVLNVTGDTQAAPQGVRCRPVSASSVLVEWSTGPVEDFAAYIVLVTDQTKPSSSQVSSPSLTNQLLITKDPLVPYIFQVRSFSGLKNKKTSTSDYSEGAVCQGQGVPISLRKFVNGSVLVTWKEFAYKNPDVLEWILQYKADEDAVENNITLAGNTINYLLDAAKNVSGLEVRLLGTKTKQWLHQNLTEVSWTPVPTEDYIGGLDNVATDDLEIMNIDSDSVMIRWRCKEAELIPDHYSFKVCAIKVDEPLCLYTPNTTAVINGLEPNTEYELTVQAMFDSREAGPTSMQHPVKTKHEVRQYFKDITTTLVNSTALRVSWNEVPAHYTVHYSDQLKLPVEPWPYIDTVGNTVLINGIKPNVTTYLMIKGYDPPVHSRIVPVKPKVSEFGLNDVKYEYTRSGVRLYWVPEGPRVVRFSQDITQPMEQWSAVNVTDKTVVLEGLNMALYTYVTINSTGPSFVLNIKPRPVEEDNDILVVSVVCGIILLGAVFGAVLFVWRRRKRLNSPERSRRRNMEENETTGSEMKNIGGKLANGGSRDVGEPLLNGNVHITENPTSKTPNGKMRKGRRYEVFDFSRTEEPDTTLETDIDLDTSVPTSYNLLDTSRRPDYENPSIHSANNSFNKLPDDNMNSELRRTDFDADNSKIQPTLQPNG